MDKSKRIMISILVVIILIALIDILFMKSGLFGSAQNYISGNYTAGLWPLFYKLALGVMAVFAVLYYFYFDKDFSESLAVLLGSFIFYKFGASDVLFFWFQGTAIPSVLPWLNTNFPINIFGIVTNFTLLVSALVGGWLSFILIKFLVKKM